MSGQLAVTPVLPLPARDCVPTQQRVTGNCEPSRSTLGQLAQLRGIRQEVESSRGSHPALSYEPPCAQGRWKHTAPSAPSERRLQIRKLEENLQRERQSPRQTQRKALRPKSILRKLYVTFSKDMKILHPSESWGFWVAQSVEQLSFDFGLGCNLRVIGSSPA